eukprot:1333556-Amorphochlora_amoeboformis.AAC.1
MSKGDGREKGDRGRSVSERVNEREREERDRYGEEIEDIDETLGSDEYFSKKNNLARVSSLCLGEFYITN